MVWKLFMPIGSGSVVGKQLVGELLECHVGEEEAGFDHGVEELGDDEAFICRAVLVVVHDNHLGARNFGSNVGSN